MTCACDCHTSSGTYKLRCSIDRHSSGVPGLPSCSPCAADEAVSAPAYLSLSTRELTQAPCIYPRCDDGSEHHEPILTFHTVCDSCRKQYAKVLHWLVMDYVTIKTSMASPMRRPKDGSKHVSPKAKSFGHPAEWASDAAALIADQLNELEHDLREHLDDGAAVYPRVLEMHRVVLAYAYITRHFDALCTHPAGQDYAENLVDLHGKMRSALGQTRFAEHLPIPCPTCDVKSLVRSVGEITCSHCKRVIREDQYPFLTRIVIDDLISSYDLEAQRALGAAMAADIEAVLALTHDTLLAELAHNQFTVCNSATSTTMPTALIS